MTVRAIVPIIEYTGNGVIRKFDWDWDMIDDSSINVLVNNAYVSNWSLEGQSVVFDTAPADGTEIVIFRRTIIWMPEDYVAFGRFLADKTELSIDRATLIAQERFGDALNNEPPNGIVGGSDLHTTRQEFTLTVVSERGTDAVLPLYDYDGAEPPTPVDPDATIVWAGDDIYGGVYSLAGNTSGVAATIRFRMDLSDGDPTEASAYYPNFNAFEFVSWVNVDPADDEYWMRVSLVGSNPPFQRMSLKDGTVAVNYDEPFKIRGQVTDLSFTIVDRGAEPLVDRAGDYIYPRGAVIPTSVYGPYWSVNTFGDTPPITRTGKVLIEICKDDGMGQPDGAWAGRIVTLEAIFND